MNKSPKLKKLKQEYSPSQEVQCQTDPNIQLLVLLLSNHPVNPKIKKSQL